MGAEGAGSLDISASKGDCAPHGLGFALGRVLSRVGLGSGRRVAGRKRTDGRERHDSPGSACRPWRIRPDIDGRRLWRASPKRPEVSRHRRQCRAAARAHRRSDRGLDGAGARAGLASGSRASSRARRQKRPGPRGPDRLDLSRSEPRRSGAERLGAGHDHRKLPCSGTAGRRSRRKSPCGRLRPIIRAASTRRSSSEPITGALSRSPRPSRAGRRGSSGFSADLVVPVSCRRTAQALREWPRGLNLDSVTLRHSDFRSPKRAGLRGAGYLSKDDRSSRSWRGAPRSDFCSSNTCSPGASLGANHAPVSSSRSAS